MPERSVETLFKDPEKVLLKLATPVILANGFQSLYNFIDAFWVSNLKNSRFALSGVGLAMPFAFALIAIANGIGVGTNSLISRKIGAKDKTGADNAATTGLTLSLVVSLFSGIILVLFAKPLFGIISRGKSAENAIKYSKIIFMGAPFLFISTLLSSVLRAEGDMKRSMAALVTGSLLNIILDPIFMFPLGMGIKGAALATITSRAITILPLSFWIFKQRSSYVRPCIRKLNLNPHVSLNILKVGLPASISMLFMSLGVFLFNTLVQKVYGPGGVAVYITGSRINSMASLPALGIQAAVITLAGAWWGAGRKDMLRRTVFYALKIGVLMEAIIGILIFVFARNIAGIFVHDATMKPLLHEITLYLRIASVGFVFMPISMISVGTFNGIGKAGYALVLTLFRVLIIAYPSAFFFSVILHLGLHGVWLGLLTGTVLASFFGLFLLKTKKVL